MRFESIRSSGIVRSDLETYQELTFLNDVLRVM